MNDTSKILLGTEVDDSNPQPFSFVSPPLTPSHSGCSQSFTGLYLNTNCSLPVLTHFPIQSVGPSTPNSRDVNRQEFFYQPNSLSPHPLPQHSPRYDEPYFDLPYLIESGNRAANGPGPPIITSNEIKGPRGANLFIFHLPNETTNW
jgi:hypothetical protein